MQDRLGVRRVGATYEHGVAMGGGAMPNAAVGIECVGFRDGAKCFYPPLF